MGKTPTYPRSNARPFSSDEFLLYGSREFSPQVELHHYYEKETE